MHAQMSIMEKAENDVEIPRQCHNCCKRSVESERVKSSRACILNTVYILYG